MTSLQRQKPSNANDIPQALSAKVRRPQLAAIYARKRLFRALDVARKQQRIVWLAGPPGAGKTTLASSYVEARGLLCLWYQLDESDSDVASFFHYFSQAVQVATPRHRKPLPRLTPEHLPTLGAFARRYFQAVFARFQHNSVWVFDNYHALPAAAPLQDVLREGLSALPPGMSVIAVSRNDPPPALARLNVHNAMTFVDGQALKLTPEEAIGIAQRRGRKRPPRDLIRRIHEQADGWTAGVVLMLGRANPEPGTFGPTAPQALFDYFAGEIFHQMDATTRRILLESALLPTMAFNTLQQLTGTCESSEILADLARRGYFTVRATTEDSYQYHALFRAFLLRELKTSLSPTQLRELQSKAAQLLETEGRIEDAVDILREIANWDDLTRLIAVHAPRLASESRLQTLAGWIQLVPDNLANQAPWLLYWRAQCRMMSSPLEAREDSVHALSLFNTSGDSAGTYLSWASIVYTYAIGWQDLQPLDRWLDFFAQIEQQHPDIPSPEIAARVTLSMLIILAHRQPRHPKADFWTQQASTIASTPGNRDFRVMLSAYLCIFYVWNGPFRRANELIPLISPMIDSDLSPTVSVLWQCAIGIHASARNAYTECIAAANTSRRIALDTGANAMNNIIFAIGIHGYLSAGDISTAETWGKTLDSFHESGLVDYSVYYHGLYLIAMHKGENQIAAEYARKSATLAREYGNTLPEGIAHLAYAQALFELGQSEKAREQISLARNVVEHTHSELLEYLCWFGQATDAICFAGNVSWETPLKSLLAREKIHGGMGVPLWPLRRVAELYAFAIKHDLETEYVNSVIRRRNLVQYAPKLFLEQWPWPYRFYTLGRFGIVQDDKPLELSAKGQKKPLELLKVLIALGGREVGQEKLIEALWPEAEGDTAQHAFETTLHRLRKLLGEDPPLLLKDGRLSLDERSCWVDAWAFERLLARLEQQLRTPAPGAFEPLTHALFDLYQGAFLHHESELPATLSLRERLRSRFLRVLKEIGRHHETQQAWNLAIDCYLRALEVEPLAEEFYRLLMNAYRVLGRNAEGIAIYDRCRKALHSLLGVAPSRETEALRESLEAAGRA